MLRADALEVALGTALATLGLLTLGRLPPTDDLTLVVIDRSR